VAVDLPEEMHSLVTTRVKVDARGDERAWEATLERMTMETRDLEARTLWMVSCIRNRSEWMRKMSAA
jgi:hypothetical protein